MCGSQARSLKNKNALFNKETKSKTTNCIYCNIFIKIYNKIELLNTTHRNYQSNKKVLSVP